MITKSKKILIVEDDPILIKVLGTVLEDEGFTVDRAVDGKEALDKLLHHNYGLVLLDILLPRMNGLELMRELKAVKCKTPVLVFSNFSQGENKAEALSLGAKGYYVKSDMSIKEVLMVVKKFLSTKKSSRK